MEPCINLTNVSKAFLIGHTTVHIFDTLNLMLPLSRITAIVGPSGCGKTTLLNFISHISRPDSGTIDIHNGQDAVIGYMLQDPILLPWRTLAENARLGAEVVGDNLHMKGEMANSYFEEFDLPKDAYPAEASGGMNQRVALVRTLLIEPTVLLLDEPFSNLDFDIKLKIQRSLLRYRYDNNATMILVTHDIEDAIALSDTVIVLSDKPTTIKCQLSINLGVERKDPVEARTSIKFVECFARIWDQMQYLHNNHHERI